MAIAQNGPGVTNFVTAVKTAYWNHTPMLLVTPQAANKTIGQGGFQEVEQMALFRDMVCYQEEVRDPVARRRGAQPGHPARPSGCRRRRRSTSRATSGPRSSTSSLPALVEFERPAGGAKAIAEAARLLSGGEIPRHPLGRRRRARRRDPRPASRWPSGSTRRCATTISTTTVSPAAIGSPSARSATTARRRRWS